MPNVSGLRSCTGPVPGKRKNSRGRILISRNCLLLISKNPRLVSALPTGGHFCHQNLTTRVHQRMHHCHLLYPRCQSRLACRELHTVTEMQFLLLVLINSCVAVLWHQLQTAPTTRKKCEWIQRTAKCTRSRTLLISSELTIYTSHRPSSQVHATKSARACAL